MTQSIQIVFSEWEKALKMDEIPARVTQVHDQSQITEFAENTLSALKIPLERVYGRKMPNVKVGALALWDFTALVGQGSGGEFGLGVGIGSVRILDVFSACLSVFIFEQRDEAKSHAQKIVGTILYDYARRLTHRLRHWIMDPTLGLIIPYGFVNTQLSSIVPKGYENAHEFYLQVMLSWIIAHELAHIAEGDINQAEDVFVLGMSGKPITLIASKPQPEKELNADLLALRTIFVQHSDMKPPVFTAITYFLGLLEIVDRLSTEPLFSAPSHPSPGKRLENLIESLSEALPNTPKSEIESLKATWFGLFAIHK